MHSPLNNPSDTAALAHLFPSTKLFNQNSTKDGYVTACLFVNCSVKCNRMRPHSAAYVLIIYFQCLKRRLQAALPQCGRWGQRGGEQCVHHDLTRWRCSAVGWWSQRIAARYSLLRHAAASASSCPARSRQQSGGSRLEQPPEEEFGILHIPESCDAWINAVQACR